MGFEKLELNILSASDHKKLAEASPNARESSYEFGVVVEDEDAMESFHPNGNFGCIVMNDNYFGNLRCDHLMWMDGKTENIDCLATMLIANHKGTFVKEIIFWLPGVSDLSYEFWDKHNNNK